MHGALQAMGGINETSVIYNNPTIPQCQSPVWLDPDPHAALATTSIAHLRIALSDCGDCATVVAPYM